jgi:natural product precursor
MKKKLTKKLNLKKVTVASLTEEQLDRVIGGNKTEGVQSCQPSCTYTVRHPYCM